MWSEDLGDAVGTTVDIGAGTGHRITGLQAHLATEIVRLQSRVAGRGPDSAKAYVVDDLAFVVLRGGVTVAERTMLGAGRHDRVRAMRQELHLASRDRSRAIVEQATGRAVLTSQSQILFDPDLVVELFVLGPVVAGSESAAGDPSL